MEPYHLTVPIFFCTLIEYSLNTYYPGSDTNIQLFSFRENYLFNCCCQKCISQADDPDVTSDEEDEEEMDAD